MKTDEQKNGFSKSMILCWTAFIAILGRMQPVGCRLDTTGRQSIRKINKWILTLSSGSGTQPGALSATAMCTEQL